MRLVILADSSSALPAIALLHRLHHTDHEVALVVEVAPTPSRSWAGWLRELFAPRILSNHFGADHPLATELRVEEVDEETITDAAEAAHAAHMNVSSLAGDQVMLELGTQRADAIIALLGVEAPPELASLAGEGLLQVCIGRAPQRVRADALRWSLLAGERPTASVLHLPAWDDQGDGARIISSRPVQREHADYRSFESLVEYESVEAVLSALERLENPTDQPSADDFAAQRPPIRTLHRMATPLVEVVDAWLGEHRTPKHS